MKRNRLGKSKLAGVTVVATAALLSAGVAYAAADDVASLYGPQPPADASYLRVLNASSQAVRVALAGSESPQTLAPGAVTRFSVLTQGTPARVTVDGKALADANATANATTHAGDAVTVALSHDAKGWHAARIVGRYERVDGLKATLRAFNFTSGCNAKIGVDGNGPTVFAQVAAGAQDARAINPVSAKLVGQCGAVASAALPLPALAAGDSYSLFVTGDAAKPVLSGARDALAWPPAAN
ncbi:alginate O-acetyltransferase AlgF [Paraburkholderia caffeinilytica]|uniref:alginate O-acetyltransferase AlgF n=1 Tax=Paraburkholderia caffeinilytica TaxID=1761016 RepID=UPI0038B96337